VRSDVWTDEKVRQGPDERRDIALDSEERAPCLALFAAARWVRIKPVLTGRVDSGATGLQISD